MHAISFWNSLWGVGSSYLLQYFVWWSVASRLSRVCVRMHVCVTINRELMHLASFLPDGHTCSNHIHLGVRRYGGVGGLAGGEGAGHELVALEYFHGDSHTNARLSANSAVFNTSRNCIMCGCGELASLKQREAAFVFSVSPNDVPPVKELGLYSVCGMAFGWDWLCTRVRLAEIEMAECGRIGTSTWMICRRTCYSHITTAAEDRESGQLALGVTNLPPSNLTWVWVPVADEERGKLVNLAACVYTACNSFVCRVTACGFPFTPYSTHPTVRFSLCMCALLLYLRG